MCRRPDTSAPSPPHPAQGGTEQLDTAAAHRPTLRGVEVRSWHPEGRRHRVLARRSISGPEEISYYIAYCTADTTLDELLRIAGSRWAVEVLADRQA